MTARTPRPPRPTWFERTVLDRLDAWRRSTAEQESAAAEHLAGILPAEHAGPNPYETGRTA
ncbi:hypothetical protein SAMN05216275_14114 [Streptosporangium canum]|uniref:Uncharacterized protein n=1 Tax=Streptosporangium canum TaxID=324952 RepID=A0A1I4DIC8_9ACTN|nr:hypothetical protein [Streptosporangium canum]SFK91621.1 hypothetical protein SAMN05216275_14114 [Streptosporangium canum]